MYNYYDPYEMETIEKNKKEKFIETYKKQLRYTKLALCITFYSMAALFVVLSVVLYFTDPADQTSAIIMSAFSGGSFALGTLFVFINFKVPDYNKYQERMKKTGSINTFDLMMRIEMLEQRVEELERERK